MDKELKPEISEEVPTDEQIDAALDKALESVDTKESAEKKLQDETIKRIVNRLVERHPDIREDAAALISELNGMDDSEDKEKTFLERCSDKIKQWLAAREQKRVAKKAKFLDDSLEKLKVFNTADELNSLLNEELSKIQPRNDLPFYPYENYGMKMARLLRENPETLKRIEKFAKDHNIPLPPRDME